MKRTLAVIAMGLLAAAGQCLGAEAPDWLVQQIEQAVPTKPTVQPAQPRKVLVFNRCGPGGFRHGSIPIAAKAIELLGSKTGVFEVVVSDDMSFFEPEKLNQFDAVIMNNTTGNPFAVETRGLSGPQRAEAREREAALKQSLLAFVEGGKGLVGIHAATDCFYDWPEYGKLMGGYFNGHPWNETVTIKLDDPSHPLNAAFGGQGFSIKDEIYQFREPYSRENLRVLLSLDVTRTNMQKDGIRRNDGDFAVSWVREYGKGRLFYCSLGHEFGVFTNKAVLQHYLDGIQYAIGDLKADATPSAKLDQQQGQAEEQPWRQLFNGQDLTGLVGGRRSWRVEDGALTRVGGGGDIWTADRFGDFILELEFNTTGNSGVFIRTDQLGNPVQTGIEIQILNSVGKEQLSRHDCGAVYDLVAPSTNAQVEGWNKLRITAKGNIIQVDMNDQRIIDMDLDRWTEPGKNPDGSSNKFEKALKDFPRMGHIGFQEHGFKVSYRNIRIKPLGPVVSDPRRTPPTN